MSCLIKNHVSGQPCLPTPTRLHLVRHGQAHNPLQIFYGRRPRVRLSARGIREARQAARCLSAFPITALLSSPLLRARQTARAIVACCHAPGLRVSPLITEVYSAFEGRPAAEVAARHDDIYTGVDSPFEQPRDIVRRALAFIQDIRRSHGGKHVVAVTHGDVIAFMLLHASGLPLTPHNKIRLDICGIRDTYPATGSITTLTYATSSAEEQPHISYLNPSAS